MHMTAVGCGTVIVPTEQVSHLAVMTHLGLEPHAPAPDSDVTDHLAPFRQESTGIPMNTPLSIS